MTPEFSRIVELDRISHSGMVREIAADEAERRALARRFAILAIESLVARVALHRTRRGDVAVSARISARVLQECVVTLEPVCGEIEEEVALSLRPVDEDAFRQKTVVIPADEDFEPFFGDRIDIGELVAVELALSLDPFPRAPDADAALGPGGVREDSPEPSESPFRALEERSENS